MSTLQALDDALFHLFNDSLHAPWLDAIMPWWREKTTWIPLYVGVLAFSIWRFGRSGLWVVLLSGLTAGICDFTSSSIVKPAVQRDRPCQREGFKEHVNLLVRCGKGKSFTSSHATNHFGLAVFWALSLGQAFRAWRWWPLLWAASIALGQVYVGVHYPSDVLAGALLGSGIAWLLARAFRHWHGPLRPRNASKTASR